MGVYMSWAFICDGYVMGVYIAMASLYLFHSLVYIAMGASNVYPWSPVKVFSEFVLCDLYFERNGLQTDD